MRSRPTMTLSLVKRLSVLTMAIMPVLIHVCISTADRSWIADSYTDRGGEEKGGVRDQEGIGTRLMDPRSVCALCMCVCVCVCVYRES